jgi:hypothetical protein
MFEAVKFVSIAVVSAVLVGSFLSIVVNSVIKSSQNTRNQTGSAGATSPAEHAKAAPRYRSDEEDEGRVGERVAFSPVNS